MTEINKRRRWAEPIVEHVNQHPGCTLNSLSQALRASHDRVRHNLVRLTATGRVHHVDRHGMPRTYFPGPNPDAERYEHLLGRLSEARHMGVFAVAAAQVMP